MRCLPRALCSGLGAASDQGAGRARSVLEPFDYRGVTLEDGPLLRQVLEVRDSYLRVPNDDYLKPFRQRAGKPAPGIDLGGWYTPGIFHVFGQVVSGLARMHAGTGDDACRRKVEALLQGWSECIEPDGFFFSTKPPAPAHYIYEKTVGGLLDAHLYAQNPDALHLLARITTWAEKNLDHSNPYVFNTLAGITEWYTLSENLYRASLVTGQSRYREFAKGWEYTKYWSLFAREGTDIFAPSPGYHAYSHVNTLSGAAAGYAATGQQQYLEIIRNAFEYLQQHQLYATGGYGPAERLVPEPLLLSYLDVMENHWETQCCSWAAFKLAKYLLRFTGDAQYGDWVERLIINGLGASLPTHPDGRVMYYSRHGLSGGVKTYNMPPWSCCAGTRIQAVADYHDLIFFKGPESLCVNLYTPAQVNWEHHGNRVSLRQSTEFPERDQVDLRLSLARPDTFALKLRAPSWLAGPMEIHINGQAAAPEAPANNWVTLRREWNDRDHVQVRLPMRLGTERFPRAATNPFPAAIMHGPVVLACRSPEGNPVNAINFGQLETNFAPVPGEPLSYRLLSASNVLFRPYYAFRQGEPYFIYFDPKHPWTRRRPDELRFSAGWHMNLTEDLQMTTNAGAWVEHEFTGTRVRWVGRKLDDGGRCEVSIDGKPVATVDQYDPVKDAPFAHEIAQLPEGKHIIRVTLLEERHPSSKGRSANIGGFDVVIR
jgi:uncharacterized protein